MSEQNAADYSIDSTGRDSFHYREGDHVLWFNAELMSKGPKRVIYSSSVRKWNPPFDQEEITEAKKQEILRRICRYFDSIRTTYVLQ